MANIQASERLMDLIFEAIEEALLPLRDGQAAPPFVVLLTKGGYVLQRFTGASSSECLQKAYTTLKAQDDETLAYALIYDALVTIDERDYDAVMVEAGETGQASGLRFAQRYQPKTDAAPLFTIGAVALLGQAEQYLSK